MDKKGISTIVASVLIVLVVVTAITLLWVGLKPIIEKTARAENPQTLITIKDDYTGYDRSKHILKVRVTRGSDTSEIVAIKFIINEAGNTQSHISTDVLEPNSAKVYTFYVYNVENVDSVKVAPIYLYKGEQVEGSIYDERDVKEIEADEETIQEIDEILGSEMTKEELDRIDNIEDIDKMILIEEGKINTGSIENPSMIEFISPTPEGNYETITPDEVTIDFESKSSDNMGGFVDFDNSLVLWLDMEEDSSTLKDKSNYANDAKVVGAEYESDGKYGSAYSFDNNEYIEVQDDATLDLTTSLTLAAWVNINELSDYAKVIIKPSTIYENPWELYVMDLGPSGKNPRILLSRGLKDGAYKALYSYEGTGHVDTWDNPNFNLDEWHHIVATFDGHEMRIYLDGELENSGNANNPDVMDDAMSETSLDLNEIATNDIDLTIGNLRDSFGDYIHPVKGRVDEVMIFNRALDEEEVKSLYDISENPFNAKTFSSLGDKLHNCKAHVVNSSGESYSTESRMFFTEPQD